MVQAHDLTAAFAALPGQPGRHAGMTAADLAGAFATLAPLGNGGVFIAKFSGESAWERHPMGDELVQVIRGETELSVMADGETTVMTLSAGMVTVVPRGCWHRFHAPTGVDLMTVTPQPTDHAIDTPSD